MTRDQDVSARRQGRWSLGCLMLFGAALLWPAGARAELVVTRLAEPIVLDFSFFIAIDLDNSSGGSTEGDAYIGGGDADTDFLLDRGAVEVADDFPFGTNVVVLNRPENDAEVLDRIDESDPVVGPDRQWSTGEIAGRYSFAGGPFLNQQNPVPVRGFIGARVGVNYGWLEVTYAPLAGAVTLHAFAYETTPGMAATIAETPVGPSYRCWGVKDLKNPKFEKVRDPGVSLTDRFAADDEVDVVKPFLVCNVAAVDGEASEGVDLCCYKSKGAKLGDKPRISVADRFGGLELEAKNTSLLFCQPCAVDALP